VEHTPFLSGHLDLSYLCRLDEGAAEVRLSLELLDYRWIDPSEPLPLVHFHHRSLQAAAAVLRSAAPPP
jgi:8-oxo-dGTP pyrophosphatase MutT (NUDIX family)